MSGPIEPQVSCAMGKVVPASATTGASSLGRGDVNRRKPQGPGDAYTGIVACLWPQLGDEDPQQYDLDNAYVEVATDRTLNLQTGEWEAIPSTGIRALLRITCIPALHFNGEAPMLAEVWNTSYGLLFVSKLPRAVSGPQDDSGNCPAHRCALQA